METNHTLALSGQQRRTWECHTRADASLFTASCLVTVPDSVDERCLERALGKLAERHEILRTDLRELVGHRPGVAAGVHEMAGSLLHAQPVSGSHGRMIELRLPALVADRRTLYNLVSELNGILGDPQAKPRDSAPYALVAQWQQDLLLEPEAQIGVAFWRSKLTDPPPPPRLLLERTDPAAGGFVPERVSIPTGPDVAEVAQALAEKLGIELQSLLLTAWKTLIARFTGAAELLIGVTYGGRTDEELASVVGPLARVLPVRLAFDRRMPMRSAIEETDRCLFEAEAWQECYPEDPGGIGTVADLLPFVFELCESEASASAGPLRVVADRVYAQSFRLRLTWRDASIDLDFDGTRLEGEDVRRLGEAFIELLRGMCAAPNVQGGEISILPAQEREQVLRSFCIGPPMPEEPPAVHEQFIASAAEMPDRIAMTNGEWSITYGRLQRWTRCIAAKLTGTGVGHEDTVGIIADRSPQMIAAVLAVMRTGAAFVPIDALAPPQRQSAVIAHAAPKALIVPAEDRRQVFDEVARAHSLPLVSCAVGREDEGPAALGVHPDNTAYVLYTSGSTGSPKGVVVPHRALANHMAWIMSALELSRDDRTLQRTLLGFDASIWEIFAPLLTGGCLVLCGADSDFDIESLLETVYRCEPTVMQTVPSVLQALWAAGLSKAGSIRALCSGGEVLSTRLWNECALSVGRGPVNLYGPTETCIDASWWDGGPANGPSIPIGRPIAGAELFITEGDDLAGVGIGGEVCIGGVGLARGYLNQPQSTAAVFVPHPWAGRPGARLYRSGDFAFWSGAGAASFLGRQDEQVKVRGVRLQLEEIRAALLEHSAIRDCAVIQHGEEHGRRELIAFVELQADQNAAHNFASDWQRHLRSRLPDVMVPAHFTVVTALPRAPNGKLDRAALSRVAVLPGRATIRTPTELQMAAIWKQLLSLDEIDGDANFFALGGHSLLLTKVVARVDEELHVRVPMRALFDVPTLSAFSSMVDSLRTQAPASAVAVRSAGGEPPHA